MKFIVKLLDIKIIINIITNADQPKFNKLL